MEEAIRLRRAIVQLARSLNVTALDSGLTPTEASVLGIVAVRGPLPAAEVARIERLNPTMASRVVASLDRQGLLTRAPDPNDRRAAVLAITDEGTTLHTRLRAERAGVMQRTAARLPHELHQQVVDSLKALEALADMTD